MALKNIFDTHAHYDDESFESDFNTVIDYILDNGVSNVLNVGCDIESSNKSVSYSKTYPQFFAGVGIHPENCEDIPNNWLNQISDLTTDKKVVAIGEIGLDYHYPDVKKDVQIAIFEQQLILAKEKNLPVIVHCR
ncbi:MAG: TatD family hydrolase, partial [Oscillospiraceae bacterium]